ncbi:PAS domain S-box-containing protein [Streptomyces sp. TLI_235]|nr:SpoIIE family protein phosphatase [Streptomyces sp. TLI_235]PBC77053.1 PAS domain S-box-containing protein [Streptomyces sp. TLI_235]
MTDFDGVPDGLPFRVSGAADEAVAIVVTDSDGRVTGWSRGAQALWGFSSGEIIGKLVVELLTTEGDGLRHRDGHSLDEHARWCALLTGERSTGFVLVAEPRERTGAPGQEDLLQWVFDQFPTAIGITDVEAHALRLNQEMARITADTEEEIRDRLISDFLPGTVFADQEKRVLRVASTGEPMTTEIFVKAPGEPKAHPWALDTFPLKDAAGRVRGVAVSTYDYSQQYDSRERLALLSEARTRMGMSLDIAGTARELAELAAPRFADVVSVELLDAVFQGDLPAAVLAGPVALRRAAYRSASSEEDQAAVGEPILHPASSPVARCVITGQSELHHVTAAEAAPWFHDMPAGDEGGTSGVHSLIVVPIRARGITLGAALFSRDTTSREPFAGSDDLTITEDLVARAAICLDNARRFNRERGIAVTLQRTLLPRRPIVHSAVETAARYVPAGGGADAGGDWFDVIPLPGERVGLVAGDVVGHGINASATMGQLRTAVRTLADIDLSPDELLTHLDDIVTHAAEGEIPGSVGATCLYAIYDPVRGVCSMARAGHPPPILVHPDRSVHLVDVPSGPPLGLGSLPFEAIEFPVPEGSLLALFTDGLIEHHDYDVDNRLDELGRALAQAAPSLESLCDTVLGTLHTRPPTDDVALLIAHTRILDLDHVAEWDLPEDPAIVADARKQVSDTLTAWGLEEMVFTTELLVSELVTNAIRHGAGPIHLRLIREQSLICEVSDGSSTAPHLRRARLSDEGGRGLFLVAQFTQRWGTRYSPTGKTIWAEQQLDALIP